MSFSHLCPKLTGVGLPLYPSGLCGPQPGQGLGKPGPSGTNAGTVWGLGLTGVVSVCNIVLHTASST